jgi:hypothetical protein
VCVCVCVYELCQIVCLGLCVCMCVCVCVCRLCETGFVGMRVFVVCFVYFLCVCPVSICLSMCCACMYVCMYVCIYIYIYIYIYTGCACVSLHCGPFKRLCVCLCMKIQKLLCESLCT